MAINGRVNHTYMVHDTLALLTSNIYNSIAAL